MLLFRLLVITALRVEDVNESGDECRTWKNNVSTILLWRSEHYLHSVSPLYLSKLRPCGICDFPSVNIEIMCLSHSDTE